MVVFVFLILFRRILIMKNIFSRMAAVALTMWLGFAAGTANALPASITGWTGSNVLGYTATFENSGITATPFSDFIAFTLPTGASGIGAANATGGTSFIASFFVDNVTLTAFNLTDTLTTSVLSTGGLIGPNKWQFSFSGLASTPHVYHFNVKGTTTSGLTGSYSGNAAISPVPEPETYAMLLIGLALLGFTARRRNMNS